MAKVNIKSEKITPFGGIYYASKAFYALSLDKVINGTLVSVSAMLVYIHQKNIAQVFILERYFFVSICPAVIPGTCLAVFLVAVLPLCL